MFKISTSHTDHGIEEKLEITKALFKTEGANGGNNAF